MPSIPGRQSLAATTQPDFNPIILAFIEELRREAIAERYVTLYTGPANHFLIAVARPPSGSH